MADPAVPLFAEVRALALFDGLTDGQLQALLDVSEVVTYAPGQLLYAGPGPADHWWVNLGGTVDLVAVVGREEMVFARFVEPGQWAGGHRAWDDEANYAGVARATSVGRALKVPASGLRALLAELPLISHLSNGLFRSVRAGDAQLRQRQAVITLGSLAAGFAHELNNPASAASSAASGLRRSMAEALASVDRLAAGDLTPVQFSALSALRHQIGSRVAADDALAAGDLEDALSRWLVAHGLDRDWLIAPALAAHGVDLAWCEQLAAAVQAPQLQASLDWVESTLTVDALVEEMEEATRRVSELVAAVKSYSQMDRASRQRTDVTEGLESTLVMLGHMLDGITVLRRYEVDLPEVDAYPGELNQVWTNLITNAVDAMGGHGTLTLAARREDDVVAVDVADTGSGMSPEVAARAFEPFFTTKDVGSGAGLGLDVAQRIVVLRHAGTIAIDSQPGTTVVHVRLRVDMTSARAED